jgi:hypothetical protein
MTQYFIAGWLSDTERVVGKLRQIVEESGIF